MTTETNTSAPNWPKRVGYALLVLVVLVVLLLISIRVALKSSWGLGYVENKIEAMAPAGQKIDISTINGDLLGAFEIERLRLSDSKGQWMTARDVKVNWSYWSMIKRRLLIENISADIVDVTRRPEVVASDEPLQVNLKSYDIRAFKLGKLSLAEGVFGPSTSLTAKGLLNHGDTGGTLVLDADVLTDSEGDSADIEINWSPDFLLTGNANITGMPNGLIQRSLKLQSQQTLKVELDTQGQVDDITTTLQARIGEEIFANGQITKRADKAQIMGGITPSSIPALEAAAGYLGGQVKFQANVRDLGATPIVETTIAAPKLDAAFTATKRGDVFSISNIDATALTPLSGLEHAPASLQSVRITGAAQYAQALTFSGRVFAEDVRYDSYAIRTISGPLSFNFDAPNLAFSTELTGDLLDSEKQSFDLGGPPKVRAKGTYNLENMTLALSTIDARIPGLSLQADGQVDIKGAEADMKGNFDIEKGVLGGRLPASLSGTFNTETQGDDIALKVNARAKEFDDLPAPLGTIIGEAATIKTRAVIQSDSRDVRLQNFDVQTDGAQISGSGEYKANGTLAFDATYEINGFEYKGTKLSDATGQVSANGEIGAINFDLDGQTNALTTPQINLTDIEFIAVGKQNGDALIADITLDALKDGDPATLQSELSYEQGRWSASNTSGSFAGLNIQGDLAGVGGDLTQLSGQLNLSGDPSAFVPAKAVNLDLSLTQANVKADGTIEDLTVGALSEANLNIKAAGPRNAVAFTLSLQGETEFVDITRELDLTANGMADLGAPYASIRTDLKATLGRHDITTNAPFTFSQTASGYVGNGELALFDGTLSFALDGSPQTLEIQGNDMRVAPLMSLMGRAGLEGRTGFEASLTQTATGFDGVASAKMTGVRQPGSDVPPLDVTLEVKLLGDLLSIDMQTTSGELSGNATLGGRINTLSSVPFVTWPPQTPLQGTAKANGGIGALAELFLPPETDITGNLALDMSYSIPLDARGLNGTLVLNSGSLEQGNIGLSLENIVLESEFIGTSVSVSRFAARDTKGGTISGSGKMDIGAIDGSAVTLSAKNMHIFNLREGFAVLSGELDLTHNGELLALAGELIVDDAAVSIDKFPRAGRPTLDVDFNTSEEDDESPPQTATKLDIKITSPGRIKLRGRGVNAMMAINADVSGAFNAPILSGEASITRGRFNFLGKRFDLADSKVIFNDDVMKSRLDVAAIRETADLTATIKVTGILNRPEIELEATPELPEDEIISRILFGRSASQLTTIETARLAAALAQLSGGGGFDLMGGLEDALGLDTLDIGQSETGQTQLTTGKYLSDNVYVEVRGAAEGTPGIAVEWTPRKNVSVEAETAPGERQRVTVQWQKDFD